MAVVRCTPLLLVVVVVGMITSEVEGTPPQPLEPTGKGFVQSPADATVLNPNDPPRRPNHGLTDCDMCIQQYGLIARRCHQDRPVDQLTDGAREVDAPHGMGHVWDGAICGVDAACTMIQARLLSLNSRVLHVKGNTRATDASRRMRLAMDTCGKVNAMDTYCGPQRPREGSLCVAPVAETACILLGYC